ncbi:MAG: hypothetical protein ACJ735_16925 [Actinomycetes bacterium]
MTTARRARTESAATEPGIDLAGLETEIRQRGLAARPVSVAYLIRFHTADSAAAAEEIARADGLTVAAYTDATDRLLRLTRSGRLTSRWLRRDQEYVLALCKGRDGRLVGLVVEDAVQDDYWGGVAERLIPKPVEVAAESPSAEDALGA